MGRRAADCGVKDAAHEVALNSYQKVVEMNGEYAIIEHVEVTGGNYAKTRNYRKQFANEDADAYSDHIEEAESFVGADRVFGDIYSKNGKGEGAVRSLAKPDARNKHGANNRQGAGDCGL